MAFGKNKRLSKGKKGSKKKVTDPFLRKEWYDLKAPSMFTTRKFGMTIVSRSQGQKLAVDSLRGRVFEVSLGDLNNDEQQAFRKIKLSCEDIQGRNCLTDFHGMDMTRDKLCSLIRKWYTLIEANVDVKTVDGYTLRLFSIAFTNRRKNQVSATCYAQSSQIRQIRKKMVEIMQEEASKVPLRELVKKFIAESIGKNITKQCKNIFPLQNVFIRKVKILKKPKLDIVKFMELHTDSNVDSGRAVVAESAEAKNLIDA